MRLSQLTVLCLVCLMSFGCVAKQKPQPQEPEVSPMVVKFEKFRQTYDEATFSVQDSEFDLTDVAEIPEADVTAGTASKGSAPEARQTASAAKQTAAAKKKDTKAAPAPAISLADSGVTSVVLSRAHKSIGTPYVLGGTQPGGFDCSGLVQWAYKGAGISLPRTAREQSQSGFGIQDKSQIRAGDIVCFRRRGGYHTGIYIGDGKFIHAPRKNKSVRIESMDTAYFARNFIGARRVNTSNRNLELALAQAKADQKAMARKGTAAKNQKTSSSSPSTYMLQKGDTLIGIAKKYHTTVAQLMAVNNIKDPKTIRFGQKLKIPAAKAAAPQKKAVAQKAQPAKAPQKTAAKQPAKPAPQKTAAKQPAKPAPQKTASKPEQKQTSSAASTEKKAATNAKG